MELQSNITTLNRALKTSFKGMTDEMQQCIADCLECHRACEQSIPYCLEKGGMHAKRSHIEMLFTCADVCRTAAHFMMWNSDLYAQTCKVCAEACVKCAKDCESMSDDQVMCAFRFMTATHFGSMAAGDSASWRPPISA